MKKLWPWSNCPCGSGQKFKKCCKPYLDGDAPPAALHLLRARYVAYVLGRADFIIETTHPDSRDTKPDRAAWAEDILKFCQGADFEGLDVLKVEGGEPVSHVTFKANLFLQGRDASFKEKSRFKRHEGRWRYVGGDTRSSLEIPRMTD